MKVTKYGHACLLVEEANAHLLIDPGTFSKGFEGLTGLSAILYTHKHGDHYDPKALKALLESNPDVRVIADEGTAELLKTENIECEIIHERDVLDVAGVKVDGIGSDHAVMHPDRPIDPNVGYLIADRLFHAGDNYIVPAKPVEILAFAIMAPWAKASETIDYVRAVEPKIAIPIHDALIGSSVTMYTSMVDGMTHEGIKVVTIADGESAEF